MIKFFQHFRQRMIKESRVSKYLLYAIGEIVLVVIGILIALQVNNWNNKRQLRQLEIKYLKELSNNLVGDSTDVQFNINFNEIRYRSNKMVLICLNENENYSDTMDVYFGNLLYTTRSVVNFSAYETLKSKGLEIISNDSLRKMITRLYSFHYRNVIDFEIQDDHAVQYHIVMPEVSRKVKLFPAVNVNDGNQLGQPINFEALKQDEEFKNALVLNLDVRSYMLNNYYELAEHVSNCQKHIRQELKRAEK